MNTKRIRKTGREAHRLIANLYQERTIATLHRMFEFLEPPTSMGEPSSYAGTATASFSTARPEGLEGSS